jgi:hypothetical protein
MFEADSALTFARLEEAGCFPILFEIGSRKVVNFVLLRKPSTCIRVSKPSSLRSSAAERKWDRYASNAKLSGAARGRSFHRDSSPSAMSSGNSNLTCMTTTLHYLKALIFQPSRFIEAHFLAGAFKRPACTTVRFAGKVTSL